MGFLAPLLLALGVAVAVPLILHLLQRQQGPRVIFPALRYLRRAEREHARRIRLRQVLLLALRIAALLLLALAAARPFLRTGGAAHPPTAVAIVLDNSASTGTVIGERRVLDALKERALEALALAGPEDRFWLIRAGEPWQPALPGDALQTAERVRATAPAAGAADLSAALARAAALLASGAAGRPAEIHLLSDLQASGFRSDAALPADAPPVLVLEPGIETPPNAGVTAVTVAGGLAPRAGERASVTAAVAGSSGDSIEARLVLQDRVVAAALAAPGSEAVFQLPARAAGAVSGWVEVGPDAFRADDRRYFSARYQPPPSVRLAADAPFVQRALEALAEGGRAVLAPAGEVVIAPAAAGADAVRSGRNVVVLAPANPTELPAVNNRLASVGVPWRLEPPGAGDVGIAPPARDRELAAALRGARVRQAYGLRHAGPGTADTLLALTDGTPWVVRGSIPDGATYVIVGSPLVPEATSLPTSAAMIPFIDRLAGTWTQGHTAARQLTAGDVVEVPAGVTRVETPDGAETVAPGQLVRPAAPGVIRFVGDGVVHALPVNTPAAESVPERASTAQLRSAIGAGMVAVDADAWGDEVFGERLGRESWRPLVLLALIVLLVESFVAATGGLRRRSPAATSRETEPVGAT